MAKNTQATAAPQANPDVISDELQIITEETVLAQFPLQAPMTPDWEMKLNARLAMWLEPDEGEGVHYCQFAPWEQVVDGEEVQYVLVVPAVAGPKGVRRVVHDGRTFKIAMRLAFLAFPDFINTGKDTYTFDVRCLTHTTRGQVLAINVTKYQTKPLAPKKEPDPPGTKPAEAGQAKQAGDAKAAAAAQVAAAQQSSSGTAKK